MKEGLDKKEEKKEEQSVENTATSSSSSSSSSSEDYGYRKRGRDLVAAGIEGAKKKVRLISEFLPSSPVAQVSLGATLTSAAVLLPRIGQVAANIQAAPATMALNLGAMFAAHAASMGVGRLAYEGAKRATNWWMSAPAPDSDPAAPATPIASPEPTKEQLQEEQRKASELAKKALVSKEHRQVEVQEGKTEGIDYPIARLSTLPTVDVEMTDSVLIEELPPVDGKNEPMEQEDVVMLTPAPAAPIASPDVEMLEPTVPAITPAAKASKKRKTMSTDGDQSKVRRQSTRKK